MHATRPSIALSDRTRQLVHSRPPGLTLRMIADDCDLTYPWLEKFLEGKHDASTSRVQRLYEYLSGKPLIAD